MSNKRFSWGKVLETFEFVIDGHELWIVKYHPWMRDGNRIKVGTPNLEVVEYNCDEICQSANSMMVLIIAWITYKQLGCNQDSLVCGIARMLKLEEGQ